MTGKLLSLLLSHHELIIYTVITILLASWFHWRWKHRQFLDMADKLPGPTSYPLIGTTSMFTHTYDETIEKLKENAERYNYEPVGTWIGPIHYVSVVKPEDIQIVLNNSRALEKGQLYWFLKSLLGEGLLTASVDRWRKHRRVISYAFNVKFLEQLYPVFNEKNKILVKNLRKNINSTRPFDLWDYIISTTFDTICHTAMDYRINEKHNKTEFLNLMTTIAEELVKTVNRPYLYPSATFSIYKYFSGLGSKLESINKLPLRLIDEKRTDYHSKAERTMKSNPEEVTNEDRNKFKTFVDTLFEACEKDPDFTDDDVRDEVITMMFAGSDTNATTECFCFLMLAIHQDVQDEVYDELYNVVGDDIERNLTPEDMAKLVYMEQVLKETLRMYPTISVFTRQLSEDIRVTNHVLPKGASVTISPMVTHHCPRLYPNPGVFNPDRFSAENVAKRHKYSYIAFSGGARGCIGMKYAMISMKLMVSEVLRNFSVHTDIKLSDVKIKTNDAFTRKVGGYPITILPRDRRPSYVRNPIQPAAGTESPQSPTVVRTTSSR
ncbi:Cytochrome P450,Cytochrome P450, E-class, group IV,Cytochrome P450, conserved site [Cinara cedri]|uniref:Cytochrome P450,Cytochrome P450, E-class, group IV,Cytochrome P450, conserved site n=1 Tax=Cinara cedri TaxID=506608 RepID=A0A5E4M5V6_9HEMI|nr:Cytochrome P450,Cytochrome P450, E-class, group IV,Cytochrome P450, conserved site [Cinara cedri]